MEYYSELDIVITPFYFLLIVSVAYFIRLKNRKNPVYKFFLPGLIVKCFGALALCLVYTHYYGYGGDTYFYHSDATALLNLSTKNFIGFLQAWLGENTTERYSLFNEQTGYLWYWNDDHAYNVIRLIIPLEVLSFNSFPGTALLTAFVAFSGLWKLFLLFSELYPDLKKHFAFAIFFFPSIVFWCSGILKDTFTVTAVCWYCFAFYKIFIQQEVKFSYLLYLTASIAIMIMIKPYAFVALLPGSILWGISGTIKKIKNVLLKIALGPLILIIGSGMGMVVWTVISPTLGRYSSIESMIEKAHESQQDLKREYYQGNSFDIGDFERTPSGVLAKFPEATVAGLFRPFIWEAKNILMVISGLENLFILCFTVFFLIRVPISFFRQILQNPFVTFCIIFTIFFAFAVGLSTSNFGALVRFKIPLWPFFLSALFVINHHRIKYKFTRRQEIFS